MCRESPVVNSLHLETPRVYDLKQQQQQQQQQQQRRQEAQDTAQSAAPGAQYAECLKAGLPSGGA